MTRRPPRSTLTDTLFPYTTLFRSLDHGIVAGEAGLEHDKSLDDTASVGIRHANHPAFGDRLVLQQRPLDLRASNVVARGDNHVVVARLVKQVAVVIHPECVAGQVPAFLYKHLLSFVVEIAADRKSVV